MSDVKLYAVIFEWDGQPPTSTWYRWLDKLANVSARRNLRSQAAVKKGKKARRVGIYDELDVLVDGDHADSQVALYVQEGAILTRSHSLAKTIFALLSEGFPSSQNASGIVKPRDIIIAEMDVLDGDIDQDTAEALARIRRAFSRRGAKPKVATSYTVMCLEELETRTVTTNDAVVNCPVCGATHVQIRVGDGPAKVAMPDGDLFTGWVRTRFVNGRWEIPDVVDGADVPGQPDFRDDRERDYTGVLAESPIVAQIERLGMDDEDGLRLLDAVFASKMYFGDDKRLKARIKAIQDYIIRGGDVTQVSLAELPGGAADIFDAAVYPEFAGAVPGWALRLQS